MPLLTIADVCRELRCSRAYLLHLRARGVLPAVKLGRSVRFTQAAVERAVEKLTEEVPSHLQALRGGRPFPAGLERKKGRVGQ